MLALTGLLVLALPHALIGDSARPASARPAREVYWVFLNSGENKTPLQKPDAEKMQAEHVGNFGKLAKLGTCLMAGPLGDKGTIRGIVVLKVPSKEDVLPCFVPDPFVQNRYLAVDACRWLVDTRRIHKAREPFQMKEYCLVVLRKGPAWEEPKGRLRASALEGWLASVKAMAKSGELAVSGPLVDAGDRVGIAIVRTRDLAAVRAALDADAAVRTGRIAPELHPLWNAAGVLGD